MAMILIIQDIQVLLFHAEAIWLPTPSQFWEMTKRCQCSFFVSQNKFSTTWVNLFSIFPSRDEKAEGLVHLWQGFSPPSIKTFAVFDSIPIQKVAIGHAHCTFLTRWRQLFVFGSNSHGQLGIGTPQDCYDEPMQVPSLRGKWTHCGLVIPYGSKDLGQHWLK